MTKVTTALEQHLNADLEQAKKDYKELLLQNPNNIDALHLLAIAYGQQGLYEQASEYLNKALILAPKDPQLYNSKANILKRIGQIPAAITVYKTAIKLNTTNPASHYNLSLMYFNAGEYNKATGHLELALKYNIKYIDAYHTLIHIFHIKQQYSKAKNLIEQGYEQTQNIIFYKLRGQNYALQNLSDKAIEQYELYLAACSDDYQIHHYLAVEYLKADKADEAAEHNLKALKINPEHAESCHNLAVIYLTQNKLDPALRYWMQALQQEPSNLDYLYNIGVVYNYKGLYTDALIYFKKVLTAEPKHYNAIVNIATIYLKKYMPAEAKFFYQKALQIKPEDSQTKFMLAALDNSQNKFTSAPEQYVTDLFNEYANTFDEHLTKMLHYKAPEVIYNLLIRHIDIEQKDQLICCDVGCGTGLMGEKLVSHAKELIGVDLAPKMLAKAREKSVYTKLITADVHNYLGSMPEKFDLITAADVMPYFGDIAKVMQAAHKSLMTNGYIIFTCENYADDNEHNYFLSSNARFSHKQSYVLSVLHALNFKLICNTQEVTRTQAKVDIKCDIYIAQKVLG